MNWEIVLLRELPGPDGRVPTSAFIGTYRVAGMSAQDAIGYARSLPQDQINEAQWIGITRWEAK